MKKKIILIVLISVIVIAAILLGVHFIIVREQSKQHGLVTLSAGDLPAKQVAAEDDYAQLGEVKMHYVRYGNAPKSVILIHGNRGDAYSLETLAQYLAGDYTVYCIASRCQGKSSDPGEITYDLMAKDVYEFIAAKALDRPYVLGHSDGAIVALSLASLYPDSIGACVSCGANSHPDKFKKYFTWGVRIRNLFAKDKLNDLMLDYPDFTPAFLARVTVPTYVVAGEYDIMPLSDSVYIHEQIANSRIAIVKGADHSSYILGNGGRIYHLAYDFFKELDDR